MKKITKILLSISAFALIFALIFTLEGDKANNGMAVSILQKSAILAIAAVSMNLLNGFTGLFSLGQAGFMAIGAYTTAILTIPVDTCDQVYYITGLNKTIMSFKMWLESAPEWIQPLYPFLALIVGGLVAAVFAGLIGIPVLRLKSDYLAIATLGFSEIIRAIISSPQLDTITNGSYGLKNIAAFSGTWVIFVVAILCIAFMVLLIKSSYGRAFKSIREDEVAAEAMGVNLFKHKQMAFITSSFFTGVAGGMLAMFMRSIDAKTFSIALTYDILLIIVIGGIGSVTGSVFGAFLVTACKEWWLRFFDAPLTIFGWNVPLFRNGFRMVIFSLLLMAVVLFYRKGIFGTNEFSWDGVARLPKLCKQKLTRKPKRGGEAK